MPKKGAWAQAFKDVEPLKRVAKVTILDVLGKLLRRVWDIHFLNLNMPE
jgi:hypothetical protein